MVKYVNPGQLDEATIREKNAIVAIADRIQVAIRHADTTSLMVQINGIVSEYISVEEHDPKAKTKPIDISKIDFELLRREFAKRKNKNLILRDLQAMIEASIKRALQKNSTRIDYYERPIQHPRQLGSDNFGGEVRILFLRPADTLVIFTFVLICNS